MPEAAGVATAQVILGSTSIEGTGANPFDQFIAKTLKAVGNKIKKSVTLVIEPAQQIVLTSYIGKAL